MTALTDANGKDIFNRIEIEAKDYSKKLHGSLFIANVPLVDRDRKIDVKKGNAIAVPDGFIEKFQPEFFSSTSVPPRGNVKGGEPPKVQVVSSPWENWKEEELASLQRRDDERAAKNQDVIKLVFEKESMKREIDTLTSRLAYIEGLVENMADTGKKSRSRKTTEE